MPSSSPEKLPRREREVLDALFALGEDVDDVVTKAEGRRCEQDGEKGKPERCECERRRTTGSVLLIADDLAAKMLRALCEPARRQLAQRWKH